MAPPHGRRDPPRRSALIITEAISEYACSHLGGVTLVMLMRGQRRKTLVYPVSDRGYAMCELFSTVANSPNDADDQPDEDVLDASMKAKPSTTRMKTLKSPSPPARSREARRHSPTWSSGMTLLRPPRWSTLGAGAQSSAWLALLPPPTTVKSVRARRRGRAGTRPDYSAGGAGSNQFPQGHLEP